MKRLLPWVLLLVACTNPTTRPMPLPAGVCVDDVDCGDPALFFCDAVNARCVPACRVAADCQQRPAAFALEACAGSLGCQCDQGTCVAALCSADTNCAAGLACRNGACVTAPTAEVVSRCSIVPEVAVVKPGATVRFSVLAWDATGAPVVAVPGAVWSTLGGSLVGAGVGNTLDFEASTATPGSTDLPAVEARFGGVRCEARALVLPAPAAFAVSVTDARTGRPIAGAHVVLSQLDGTLVPQASGDWVETDVKGVAQPTVPSGAFSVSVFHPDFSYLTVVNVEGGFLSLALERNPLERFGGFAGTLSGVPLTANLKLGRVGFSEVGDLMALDPGAPSRVTVPTDVTIGSAFSDRAAPLALESFLGFGSQAIKSTIAALGPAGLCEDSGDVLTGACGTRTAWALNGDVPLGDIVDLQAGGNILDPMIAFRRTNAFHRYTSSVARDVSFSRKATPRSVNGEAQLGDRAHFTPLDLPFVGVPLAFEFRRALPESPTYRAAPLDDVAALGLALVPGRGAVPLGLGGQFGTPRVNFRMAPTHHGLEGSPYVLLVERRSLASQTDASAGRAVTAVLDRPEGNALRFDVVNTVGIGAFLRIPEGRFASPQRRFTMAPLPSATVLRVRLTDTLDTRWDVLVDASAPSFTLPPVPGALRDRLSGRPHLSMEALRLPMTFPEFLERDDVRGERLLEHLQAFSFLDTRAEKLRFVALGTTLSKGSVITVALEGVQVGVDGVVQLLVTGGTNCPTAPLLQRREATEGSGRFEFTLPSACEGGAVTLEARVVQVDGVTVFDPPLGTRVTVSIL